jgi:hypothetical protein
VSPEKILKLVNGMLVINMASLFDEISAMKDEDFEKHVSGAKNDFSDWVQNAVEDKELADHLKLARTKPEMLDLLALRRDNKPLPKLNIDSVKKLNEAKAFEEMAKPPEIVESEKRKSEHDLEKKVSKEEKETNGIEATITYTFKLDNGEEIKTIGELKKIISQMDEVTFKHYVGEDYNKFADWVKKGLHNDELAEKISNIHDKNNLLQALENG